MSRPLRSGWPGSSVARRWWPSRAPASGWSCASSSNACRRRAPSRLAARGIRYPSSPASSGRPAPSRPARATTANTEICLELLDHMLTLGDPEIFAAQAHLVRHSDWSVEPAGAAAAAVVFSRRLPGALTAGRGASDSLRVCAIVSGQSRPGPTRQSAPGIVLNDGLTTHRRDTAARPLRCGRPADCAQGAAGTSSTGCRRTVGSARS